MNYVASINAAIPNCIESSPKGYMLSPAARLNRTYWEEPLASPQSSEERLGKLLCQLLLKSEALVLNDFADAVHISPESIQGGLYPLRKKLAQFHLQIKQAEGTLTLQGAEQQKRILLADLIQQELCHTRLNPQALETYFPAIDAAGLQNALDKLIAANGYFINDNLRSYLLLDVLITLYRAKHGHYLADSPAVRDKQSLPIALDDWARTLPAVEILYLQKLFACYLMPQAFANMTLAAAQDFIGTRHNRIIQKLFAFMAEALPFIPQTGHLQVRLALNLHNLLAYKELGYITHNPQVEDMKIAAPFSFVLALKMTGQLSILTGQVFTEEDAAYLSVHISLALKKARQLNLDAVNCGLMISPYFDYADELRQELLTYFPQDIKIKAEAATESDLQRLKDCQLVIATTRPPAGFPVDWVTTNPILSWEKRREIAQHLQRAQQENREKLLQDFLQQHTLLQEIPTELLSPESQWLATGTVAFRLDMAETPHSQLIIETLDKPILQNKHRISTRLYLRLNPADWEETSQLLHILMLQIQHTPLRSPVASTDNKSFPSIQR